MTKLPFFSIVVPTRNRVEYVTDCLYSLVHQTFGDLEIIVSDNSSDEEHSKATKRAVSSFLSNERVSYVRPDRPLSMTEHWNWAVSHARGAYVGIVTDRMALRLYALAEVKAAIDKFPDIDAVSFGSCVSKLVGFRLFIPRKAEVTLSRLKSADTLSSFSQSSLGKNNPRFLNSFCSRNTINNINEKYGSIFTSIAPDYAFLFRYLNLFDSYAHIFHPLLVVQGEERSNGKAFLTGIMNADSSDFRKRMIQEQAEWLRYGPIAGDASVLNNIILREYEVGGAEGTLGRFPPVNKTAFYEKAVERAIQLNRTGLLSTEARRVIDAYGQANELPFRTIPPVPGKFRGAIRRLVRWTKERLPSTKAKEQSFSVGENMKQALAVDLARHETAQVTG